MCTRIRVVVETAGLLRVYGSLDSVARLSAGCVRLGALYALRPFAVRADYANFDISRMERRSRESDCAHGDSLGKR